MELKYRHEYKFALSVSDYFIVRSRLLAALRHDPHAGTTGEYGIRSVYFDNLEDKALREKLDGVNNREKFRIRYYNGELSYLTLEKKSKRDGLCSKKGDSITAQEADRLFHGDTGWMKVSGRPVAAELYGKMKTQQLRPKTVVDYLRDPFVFPPGNVRITLDRELHTAPFRPDLLEKPLAMLPAGNGVLLEVKYDEFLPEMIRDLVQLGNRQAGAFSKYAASRAFG